MYTLSVSNICFDENRMYDYYSFLYDSGIQNLEIAPTKFFGSWDIKEEYFLNIKRQFNFKIVSMQSLFYGKEINCFKDKNLFIEHFKHIFKICEFLSCDYLVFGSPKNRLRPEEINENLSFKKFNNILKELKQVQNNIILGIELNPYEYGCNFFNKVEDIKKINFDYKNTFHFDTGCINMTKNNFQEVFLKNIKIIKNIHISQPHLKCFSKINNNDISEYKNFVNILKEKQFNGNVSLEMKSENFSDFKSGVDNFVKIYK